MVLICLIWILRVVYFLCFNKIWLFFTRSARLILRLVEYGDTNAG